MKLKIKIPDKLSEITVAQYAQYLDIVDQYEKMKQSEKNASVFYLLKTLETFTGINYEDGLKIKLTDVRRIVNKLEKLLTKKPDLIRTFKLGDTEFGFIPKLDDMTFGEYVDLDTNISDWQNMHKALAVLYRPVKKKSKDLYIIEDYDGELYHDAMKLVPLDVAFGALIFFYRLGTDLSIGMTRFLEKVKTEKPLIQSQIFQENGAGIKVSIRYLKEALQNIKI